MIDNRSVEDLYRHTVEHISACNYNDAARSFNAFITKTKDNTDPHIKLQTEFLYVGVLSIMGMHLFKD